MVTAALSLPTPAASLPAAAARLAALLSGAGGDVVADAGSSASNLVFESHISPRPLERSVPPAEVWAVDGGQALVADARCVQVVVTRAAVVRFTSDGRAEADEGELSAWLFGTAAGDRAIAASLGLGVSPDAAVDVNLLRDYGEWMAVGRAVEQAGPGAMVLVDGDLEPDWRIPRAEVGRILERAAERGVTVVGVIKHSSLSRGGAPLLSQLELDAAAGMGRRAMWWAPVARARATGAGDSQGPDVVVVAARLDPDARFAFRVDLPATADAEAVLASLSALCDDAAFPGYPYALSVADGLAACPRWLRDDVWMDLDDHLDRAGIPPEVRERAFADRHALMERS